MRVAGFRILLLLVALTSPCSAKAPNVHLIVADDLGYSDLGCFGGEIETPNLDRLAAEGVRLTQFNNTGRCCPSRLVFHPTVSSLIESSL